MTASAAPKAKDPGLSYDELPYDSFAHPQTHPAHLHTIATLFGLKPPSLKTARVLEIGCAGGGNLFPLALTYPESAFVGLDLSERQITDANRQKEALGLKNIEFVQQDIFLFDSKKNEGKFDYIICHGLFSWVPDAVRAKILEVCCETLSPRGLAVISYNVLPGWNAVRSIREMMLYHTRHLSKPAEKVAHARQLMNFMLEHAPKGNTGHRALIEEVGNRLKGVTDSYIYHDYLEELNQPFYLHEFVGTARDAGLEYVGDVSLASMYATALPLDALAAQKDPDALVAQEQYADLAVNRRFRTSILCKKIQKINRALDGKQIMDYMLTPAARLVASGQDPREKITFRREDGAFFGTDDPVSGTLFLELLNCEMPVSAQKLVSRVQEKLGLEQPVAIRDTLIKHGLVLALHGFINLHSDCPAFADTVSEKPVAFPVARFQAAQKGLSIVTNVLGQVFQSTGTDKLIVSNLDGSKNTEDLVDILISSMKDPGQDVSDKRAELSAAIQAALKKMAVCGLLIR